MLADEESFKEWDTGLTSGNPLHYKGYEDKVEALREKTGLDEAVTTGLARIGGHETFLVCQHLDAASCRYTKIVAAFRANILIANNTFCQ